MDSPPVKRALVSVSDKTGLVDFVSRLTTAGVEIYSTGGTRTHLQQAGIQVQDVAAYTGFPEILDGRVKTLHPKVHGGILCRHDRPQDMAALEEHGILTFELVVVNLYPFEATVAREGVSLQEAIEQIDIGGPSLIRGGSKNHAYTTVVTSSDQYAEVADQIAASKATTPELRRKLAAAAFDHTARYDRAIADYLLRKETGDTFPAGLHLSFERREILRYGENPHQRAALYVEKHAPRGTVAAARQLHGKELSYNNLLDLDSAAAIVRGLPGAAAVVIKHNNPCGAASAASAAKAVEAALAGDPLSAFGGVLGLNSTIDQAVAEVLAAPGLFIEAIVAPRFDPEAVQILTTRPKWKANVRLLEAGEMEPYPSGWDYRRLLGGMLMQDADLLSDPQSEWTVVSNAKPDEDQWRDLRFAWSVVRHVKSNAIVLAQNSSLVGTGAGQMSRVDSVEIAIRKAGSRASGSVLASDAFFPFPDSIELAAKAGVRAVIQPGGSKKDDEAIMACNTHGMAMVFTGRRHFKH